MSEAGSEVVCWNAACHVIRFPIPIVPSVEKVEDWEKHRDGVLDSPSSEGQPEHQPKLGHLDQGDTAVVILSEAATSPLLCQVPRWDGLRRPVSVGQAPGPVRQWALSKERWALYRTEDRRGAPEYNLVQSRPLHL